MIMKKRMCEHVWLGGRKKGIKCGVVPQRGRSSCRLHASWVCSDMPMMRWGGWEWSEWDLALYNLVEMRMEEAGCRIPEICIRNPPEEVMRKRFREVQLEWKNLETESFEREVRRIELETRDPMVVQEA